MSKIDALTKLGTIDDIIRSLDNFGETELRETLAFLLKTYVIDGGLKSSGVETHAQTPPSNLQKVDQRIPVNYGDFKELILDLKKMYSFSELKLFSVEANKTFINLKGEKHEIEPGESAEDIISNRVSPVQPVVVDQQTPASANEPKKQDYPEDSNGSGRFGNLELD